MIQTDCPWELPNLGRRTVEMTVESGDDSHDSRFRAPGYEYVVVKVPVGMPAFHIALERQGFTMIETQLSLSKKMSTFRLDHYPEREFFENTEFVMATTEQDIEDICAAMDESMFTTDRIYLDPEFGPAVSLRRYRNWLRNEYARRDPSLLISRTIYHGEEVGFGMSRLRDGVLYGLLGGVYSRCQNAGLGMLTALGVAIATRKLGLDCRLIRTAVSSNNPPVWQLYNYLDYRVTAMTNVFVRHQRG